MIASRKLGGPRRGISPSVWSSRLGLRRSASGRAGRCRKRRKRRRKRPSTRTREGPALQPKPSDPPGGRRQVGTRSREARASGDRGTSIASPPGRRSLRSSRRWPTTLPERRASLAARVQGGQGGHPALAKNRVGEGYPLFVRRGPAADRRVAGRGRGREQRRSRAGPQTRRRALGILAPRERAWRRRRTSLRTSGIASRSVVKQAQPRRARPGATGSRARSACSRRSRK